MSDEIRQSDLPFTVPTDGYYRSPGYEGELWLLAGTIVTHIGPDATKENARPIQGAAWTPIRCLTK